jgi:hypothetical protein
MSLVLLVAPGRLGIRANLGLNLPLDRLDGRRGARTPFAAIAFSFQVKQLLLDRVKNGLAR